MRHLRIVEIKIAGPLNQDCDRSCKFFTPVGISEAYCELGGPFDEKLSLDEEAGDEFLRCGECVEKSIATPVDLATPKRSEVPTLTPAHYPHFLKQHVATPGMSQEQVDNAIDSAFAEFASLILGYAMDK